MTIEEMQYDFKQKLNKGDSQQYKNLLIPEIDWLLNEAQELFVKLVANPRVRNQLGFETSQRTIDDIRTIVVNNYCSTVTTNIVTLPADYWYFLKGDVTMTKGTCVNVKGNFYVKQHDDEFEKSPFDKSNFEWRHVNGVFYEDGIRLFTDGSFTISNFCLSYIKRLPYIHNAKDFTGGTYTLPSGVVLTTFENCPLPEGTHREIVDLAVLIATGNLQIADYQNKLNKINLTELK
jgi:hypothetical protein